MTLPNQSDPSAPERAPGGGRDMPREKWQDDAWLPEGTPEMTDSKTEWRAEKRESGWAVVYGKGVFEREIARGLDKPTALKIAAVNEMEAALENLCDACDKYAPVGNPFHRPEYPEMEAARAALAKARGESDG